MGVCTGVKRAYTGVMWLCWGCIGFRVQGPCSRIRVLSVELPAGYLPLRLKEG